MTPEVWVPDACTLPSVDQPLRIAEWDDLFGSGLRGARRVDQQTARLHLQPDLDTALRATNLAMKESSCCSFFSFALNVTAGQLSLDVAVPAEHVAVLDALVDRASTPAQEIT